MTLKPAERARLRKFLIRRFSLDELKDLAFDLNVDCEVLSHGTKNQLSRELIAYCGRRGHLSCLVAEVLKQRQDDDLTKLLAKLPPCAPLKKVQIVVSQELVEHTSELLEDLARKLGVGKDEVVLVAAARGSMRLLIGVPERLANLQILSEIDSLGDGKYQVVSIVIFDSLDPMRRRAWRMIAFDYPPIRQGNMLRPAFSWRAALKKTREEPSQKEEFSMNQFLHLIETLKIHLDRIRTDLGAGWPEFAAQVQSLAPAFEAAQDETAVARAVGDLYMACRAREPVMTILRQTADTNGVGHDRRPLAGGTDNGDTMLVREIVNRFQSLLASLTDMERSEENAKRTRVSKTSTQADQEQRMLTIAEPTLEYYVYYLRRVEGDSDTVIQERRVAFEEELRALLAHLEHLSGQTIPAWEWPQESQDPFISQRIVRTDWLDNPATGRSCFVEARTYGNVYWLQVGYCQSGQVDLEIFTDLRDGAWRPSTTDHLLGSSSYLCGIAADEVGELAARALKVYTVDTPGLVVSTRRADDRAWLCGSLERPDVIALFYPDAECEDWAGRTILNDVAPRLELYKHKADRQLAWCEKNYPLLSEQERTLRELLGQVDLKKVDRASPAEIELLQQLIRFYGVYNDNVGMLVDRQTTIKVNLDNLDAVLKELQPLAEDRLLGAVRGHLRRRQRELEAHLRFANQPRQRAEGIIGALTAKLELDRLMDLHRGPSDTTFIERAGWPGAPPPVESEIDAITPHLKPPQPVTYPRVNVAPHILLTAQDTALLQRVYRGFGQVLVEKGFGGGYGGARVFLTLPVTVGDLPAARRVTKLGLAPELRRERDNYGQHVEDFLPFSTARLERDRYCEQDGQAGLSYVFVGGGALGRAMDLEEYYRRAASSGAVEQIIKTLDGLLDEELGQIWYGKSTPLSRFFAAEYGRHLVEHLRLRLRPVSSDVLWPVGQSPAVVPAYRRIEEGAIPREHEAIQPGALLSVEGLVVTRIKRGEVKLQDPNDQGIVIRVELAPGSNAIQGLEIGSQVGVRGEVVHNRRGRMEQIVCDAFPDLSPGVSSEFIQLPGVPGTHPNPLTVYPQVLDSVLEGRRSYVHGDLHLRNVLVDEGGRGWLIDFARVEKRHNLFDFIKLETYVRLMGLAGDEITFSHDEYAQFEEALADTTLERKDGATCPANSHLETAYRVIRAIRQIARNYMAQKPNVFLAEYFPALFLYCLAVIKYFQADVPQSTQLIFITTCVLSQYILGMGDVEPEPTSSVTGSRPVTISPRDTLYPQTAVTQEVQEFTWDTTTVRQLLTAAFDDERLTEFCYDHFRPVFDEFSTGMSKPQKIQRLLDYCERYDQLDKLLRLVEQHNPAQYARAAEQLRRWQDL